MSRFDWTGLSDQLSVADLVRDLNLRMPRVARAIKFLDGLIVDIRETGGREDGLGSNDDALLKAVAKLPSRGGIVYHPEGDFRYEGTINQTYAATGKRTITLLGAGQNATRILSEETTGPGILMGGTANDLYHQIIGLDVLQDGLTLPGVARSGNYGIVMTESGSPGAVLRNFRVRYFGDTGLRLEGGHGPIAIENPEVQACSSYGMHLVADGSGVTAQDVAIRGGNLQFCWGGLRLSGSQSTHVEDLDIELSTYAQLCAVEIDGSAGGNTFADITASVEAVPATPAVVHILSGRGNLFLGGLNVTTIAGVDNIYLDSSNASWNTFISGRYSNVDPAGGYYANILNGSRNRFDTPNLLTYTSGRNVVNDTNNSNTAINVGTAAVNGDQGLSLGNGRVSIAGVPVLTTQQTAIADATDPASTMARLNDLLAAARTHGLIAT